MENNALYTNDIAEMYHELKKAKTAEEKKAIKEKFARKGEKRLDAIKVRCANNGDECYLNEIAKLRNVTQPADAIIKNGLFTDEDILYAYGTALESNKKDLAYLEKQLSTKWRVIDGIVEYLPKLQDLARWGVQTGVAKYQSHRAVSANSVGKSSVTNNSVTSSQAKSNKGEESTLITWPRVESNKGKLVANSHNEYLNTLSGAKAKDLPDLRVKIGKGVYQNTYVDSSGKKFNKVTYDPNVWTSKQIQDKAREAVAQVNNKVYIGENTSKGVNRNIDGVPFVVKRVDGKLQAYLGKK